MKSISAKLLLLLLLVVTGSAFAANNQMSGGTINIYNYTNEADSIQVDKGWPSIKITPDPMTIPAHQLTLVKVEQLYGGVATLFVYDAKGQEFCRISAGNPNPMGSFLISGDCKSDKWKVQQVSDTAINIFHEP